MVLRTLYGVTDAVWIVDTVWRCILLGLPVDNVNDESLLNYYYYYHY